MEEISLHIRSQSKENNVIVTLRCFKLRFSNETPTKRYKASTQIVRHVQHDHGYRRSTFLTTMFRAVRIVLYDLEEPVGVSRDLHFLQGQPVLTP